MRVLYILDLYYIEVTNPSKLVQVAYLRRILYIWSMILIEKFTKCQMQFFLFLLQENHSKTLIKLCRSSTIYIYLNYLHSLIYLLEVTILLINDIYFLNCQFFSACTKNCTFNSCSNRFKIWIDLKRIHEKISFQDGSLSAQLQSKF